MTKFPPRKFLITSAVVLFLGVLPLPYAFYSILRLTTTICLIWLAKYFKDRKIDNQFYTFVGLAILFNPIIPIHLMKGIWVLLDIGVAIYILNQKELIEDLKIEGS